MLVLNLYNPGLMMSSSWPAAGIVRIDMARRHIGTCTDPRSDAVSNVSCSERVKRMRDQMGVFNIYNIDDDCGQDLVRSPPAPSAALVADLPHR